MRVSPTVGRARGPALAEGEGFEPSVPLKGHNGFRDRPVQPLRHPSEGPGRFAQTGSARLATVAPRLYLDQNYLSGIAKRKPAFRALEPVLRDVAARGVVAVVESAVHERESRPRPELGLLELLRELSGGRRLPDTDDAAPREYRRRHQWTIANELPARRSRASDVGDLEA